MDKIPFDQYFEAAGWDESHRAFAKLVWNAAIEAAIALVEQNFDECEPWLTPDEISELST